MATISVSCNKWLGLSKRYVVRIDNREAGRLGWRSKRVVIKAEAGTHAVLVDYNGRTTPVAKVAVSEAEEVDFELTFTWPDVVRTARRQRLSDPIGAPGEVDYMTLVRTG